MKHVYSYKEGDGKNKMLLLSPLKPAWNIWPTQSVICPLASWTKSASISLR